MDYSFDTMTPQEQLTLRLRGLYEQYGFQKYRASRFEEYRLYLENQSFLPSEQVITFTDLDGRLLAMRPDVTLSLVKNAQPKGGVQRLYYVENVYRASRESGTYREIRQMGLELLGRVDDYAKSQAVLLALRSLRAVGREYLLDLSHMGFAVGLLEGLQIPAECQDSLLSCLREKNAPELRRRALAAGLPQGDADLLCSLTTLYGPFLPTLERAEKLARGRVMQDSLTQLKKLYDSVPDPDKAQHLRLDLSMINDISYYNGIIFQGYIEGVPHRMLAGGQYDRLMGRFGKEGGAMGFALYLDQLERLSAAPCDRDADVLVEYDSSADPAAVAAAVEQYTAEGKRVLALPSPAPRELNCTQKIFIGKEVAQC